MYRFRQLVQYCYNRVPSLTARPVLAAVFLAAPNGAWANFAVCNQTVEVQNIALGRQIGPDFVVRGWWILGANQCVDVIKTPLETRFVYVFAADVFWKPTLYGTTEICVGTGKFRIAGLGDCWQRGYVAAQFLEVDTKGKANWTLFLSPPATADPAR